MSLSTVLHLAKSTLTDQINIIFLFSTAGNTKQRGC